MPSLGIWGDLPYLWQASNLPLPLLKKGLEPGLSHRALNLHISFGTRKDKQWRHRWFLGMLMHSYDIHLYVPRSNASSITILPVLPLPPITKSCIVSETLNFSWLQSLRSMTNNWVGVQMLCNMYGKSRWDERGELASADARYLVPYMKCVCSWARSNLVLEPKGLYSAVYFTLFLEAMLIGAGSDRTRPFTTNLPIIGDFLHLFWYLTIILFHFWMCPLQTSKLITNMIDIRPLLLDSSGIIINFQIIQVVTLAFPH